MKQTAVEWLMEEYINGLSINLQIMKKALEMEKEQITLSHINGQSEFDTEKFMQYNKDLAEAYYNQTFKSE